MNNNINQAGTLIFIAVMLWLVTLLLPPDAFHFPWW
jgi:hypothetical protein